MIKQIITIVSLAFASETYAQCLSGCDISLLPAYEAAGTKHLDANGKSIPNLITYLRNNAKMNAMRVRLFVQPEGKDPIGGADPAVCQDLNYVTKLGKRIKDAGLALMVDFHYSDTWADPSYQNIPASWKNNTSNEALSDSVYSYTKRCLEHLAANGAKPDYIQIGNEISYGMLWRNASDKCYTTSNQTASSGQWTRLCKFLNAGAKAVREVTPDAKIIIHTERSGIADQTKKFYQFIEQNNVDYDIIGLSYYPFWHGDLSKLSKTFSTLESAFPEKTVQIVETAYYHNYYPSNAEFNTTDTWSATANGQAQFIKDLIAEVMKHSNVNAIYYWCPEEAGNGKNKKVMNAWMNRGFWWEDSQWPVKEAINAFKTYSTTSIERVENDRVHDTTIYDISGRITTEHTNAIYIKGGKKYIRK